MIGLYDNPVEVRLICEEADRQHYASAKRKKWKADMAEAARLRDFGPPEPIPRMADEYDENEGFAFIGSRQQARESAIIEALNEKRESDYVEHCANLAGHIMPADKYAESLRRRFVRFDQSVRLTLALVEGGARSPEVSKNAPSILTLVSRTETKLPIIPRINFLPETAAARRNSMLKEVEAYAARNPLARMATFTAGQRCIMPNLREETSRFTRKISRLNAEKWFKPNCSIPFRAVEFGTFKLCARTAEWTAHIHAHTIFHPLRYMKPKKWARFCRKISAYMGTHWDGGKPIENVREMVKYPVKPADLESLLEKAGVGPVCEFYRQTKKMRLVETLGPLRRSRSSIAATKRKRVKEKNKEGEFLPAIRRNWNARGRSTTKAAQRAKRELAAAKKAVTEALHTLAGQCPLPVHEVAAPKMINRIVARLAPAPFASRVYEPAVFVWNFDGNWDAIVSHRCVARVVEVVGPKVRESLRRVSRETGNAGHNSSHQSHNCPDPVFENPPPDPLRRHLEALAT